METWRLSRIEDELEKLDFSEDPVGTGLADDIFKELGIGQRRTSEHQTIIDEQSGDMYKVNTIPDPRDDEGYSEDDMDLPPPPAELLYPDYQDNEYSKTLDSKVTRSKDKEVIYSETLLSHKFNSQTEAVNRITHKYDSLQRLKDSIKFSSTIPPGYVKTSKSQSSVCPEPTPISKKAAVPVNKPISALNEMTQHGAVPFVARSPSVSRSECSKPFTGSVRSVSKPVSPDCSVLSDEEIRKVQDVNSWLEQEEQLAKNPEQKSERRRSHYKADVLTELEIQQVEIFYRSIRTTVHVCHCETELYKGSVRDKNTFDNFYSDINNSSGWSLVSSGIPAIILDSHARKVHLILAERGTGFALWKETLNCNSNYTAVQHNFHTLHLSSDNTKLIGLSFSDAVCATEFQQKLNSIIANPEDDILNIHGKKKKKKDVKKSTKVKKPTKADISTPCFFTHITNLERNDGLANPGS